MWEIGRYSHLHPGWLPAVLAKRWFTSREHNMIRFRDGKPTGIYFSQHSDGAAYKWDDAGLAIEDERVSLWKQA